MCNVVIIGELRLRVIVTAAHHPTWSFFLVNYATLSQTQPGRVESATDHLHLFSYVGLSKVFGGKDPSTLSASGPVARTWTFLTYQHFFVFRHLDAFPLHTLHILQAAQDIMLDLEDGLHVELRAFLDGEWLALEFLERARCGQVDDDAGATFDLERERMDDAAAGIRRIGSCRAGRYAQRCFPFR